ncbi:MAG: AbrB/MazE/SpoVT family DNA-binding domain-containing protein [bacterium]
MLTKAVKISKKGQVTIPKVIREKLGTNIVSFVIEKDEIKIKPVDKETYGRLKRYSKRYIPIEEAREKTWGSVKDE